MAIRYILLNKRVFVDISICLNVSQIHILSETVSRSVMPNSAIPWAAAHQIPLSMGFSRQGYQSGLQFPSPRDLADPEIEPRSPVLQADSLPTGLPGKAVHHNFKNIL